MHKMQILQSCVHPKYMITTRCTVNCISVPHGMLYAPDERKIWACLSLLQLVDKYCCGGCQPSKHILNHTMLPMQQGVS